MPKRNVINFDDCFQLPNQGLRTFFGNVRKGQSKVYDTPFARGESTKDLLKSWNEVLVSIRTRWPSLYDYEIDMAKKVGPMSVMKPLEERISDIDSYYEGILLPSKPIHDRAVAATVHEWSRSRRPTCAKSESHIRNNEEINKFWISILPPQEDSNI